MHRVFVWVLKNFGCSYHVNDIHEVMTSLTAWYGQKDKLWTIKNAWNKAS